MKKNLYIAAVAALLFSVSSQAQYRRYTSYFSADFMADMAAASKEYARLSGQGTPGQE